MKRVSIFIDYQNVYMRARTLFFSNGLHPNTSGQIDPGALGLQLANKVPDGELEKVYVYRGMPSLKDLGKYSASRKQMASWRMNPAVEVKTLPLKYPKDHEVSDGNRKPQEKGIDVLLAIDFVTKAIKNEFDIGILFSVDSDLKPALQFVENPEIRALANVAAWRLLGTDPNLARTRLTTKGNRPFCHWLDYEDFQKVRDDTKY